MRAPYLSGTETPYVPRGLRYLATVCDNCLWIWDPFMDTSAGNALVTVGLCVLVSPGLTVISKAAT